MLSPGPPPFPSGACPPSPDPCASGGCPPSPFPDASGGCPPSPEPCSAPFESPELVVVVSAFVTKIPLDPFELVLISTFEISNVPLVFTKTAELTP